MQVPAAIPLTLALEPDTDTEQVEGVDDVNVTASPEDAVAERADVPPTLSGGMAPNEMVCDPLPTVTLWVTCVAGL